MQLQDAPIVRRVGDQEDEAIGSEIALLQARFALDGLDVGDACLGFDDDGAEGAHDPTVAAPEITGDRHGHLGLPPEARIQAAPKPFEQRQMGSVANGIPIRVERDCDLQPDHRRDPRGEVDREGARISTLCALDTVRPDPGGLGNLTDAETGVEARGHELLSDALTKQAASPRPERGRSFATGHFRSMPTNDCPALIQELATDGLLVE
jgi:hypothetical protein